STTKRPTAYPRNRASHSRRTETKQTPPPRRHRLPPTSFELQTLSAHASWFRPPHSFNRPANSKPTLHPSPRHPAMQCGSGLARGFRREQPPPHPPVPSSSSLLVFAHTPPPVHGQSLMVQTLLDGLPSVAPQIV